MVPSSISKGASVVGVSTLLLVLAHLKSLPLAYTVRSWWLLRSLVQRARKLNLEPEDLFTIVSQNERCLWDDVDYNQHMNNSSYNKKLDFGRIHLLYVVVPKVMMDPDHHIFAHNAGVFTLFKKEIPPLSPYTIQTRIWTWNEKWLFLQHRFLLDEKNIVCVAVSKIVFKRASGKTVPPMNIFDLCGHIFNNEYEDIRKKNWETAHQLLSMDKLFGDEWDGPVFASKL